MNIYLLSSNGVNTYKKFKLQEGNLYMNEKHVGMENFSGGNQINIIDNSFNLSDNIDISYLYIENNLLIDICNSFNNSKNFINGNLDICGEINMNSYTSSNDNFYGKTIFDSIELKNIYRYDISDTLSFKNTDASNSHFHSNLIIIETKLEGKNIITNNLDICNNIYSNKLNIYEKIDISNNLDICGNVHILKNIDVSNDCSIYNGNLHIHKNMTIHNDISINNYNIRANIIDVCNRLLVENFQTKNTTLSDYQFIPLAYISIISTYKQGTEYINNDTITINSELIDASHINLLIKDISCININVLNNAQFNSLIVDGSFSFNSIIENMNSTNDEILITTQLDISNIGSGIALKIAQGGSGDEHDVLHIISKSENIVLKINSSGNIIFYKDLIIHGELDIYDNLIIHHNLDICGNVDISNNLIVHGNVDICNNLYISDSLNIHGNVDICGSFNINEITIIEKDNIHFVEGDISNIGSYYGYGTVPIGGIIMWSGTEEPYGWTLCDGNNETPDLRGRFVMSSTYNTTIEIGQQDANYNIHQIGGSQTVTLNVGELPLHTHSIIDSINLSHNHTDYINNDTIETDMSGEHTHDWSDNYYGNTGTEHVDVYNLDKDFNESSVERTTDTHGMHTHDVNIQHNHTIQETSTSHNHDCGYSGNGESHENLPPYYVLAFIMRIS